MESSRAARAQSAPHFFARAGLSPPRDCFVIITPRLLRYPLPLNESEDDTMTIRLLRHAGIFAAAALIAIAVGGKPAAAVGSDNPPPPTTDEKKKEKKSEKKKKQQSVRDLQQDKAAHARFLEGYQAARELILDGKYEQGIAAMHALGYDSHPDVANYVGYSYRRLGDYDQSKHWYELALAADPKHARTWSYYGMWQAEQGNRLKAEDFLQKVKLICGNESCKEFTELKAVIDGKASY